jgi:hypothetical protein
VSKRFLDAFVFWCDDAVFTEMSHSYTNGKRS